MNAITAFLKVGSRVMFKLLLRIAEVDHDKRTKYTIKPACGLIFLLKSLGFSVMEDAEKSQAENSKIYLRMGNIVVK